MAERAKKKPVSKVDVPVQNQENPVISEKERKSTDTPEHEPTVPKMAKANKVDDTVKNQENPGGAEIVDRQPDPVVYEDNAGIKYDVSKPYPELMTSNPEEDKRKAKVRQTESVMDAKNLVDDEKQENDHKYIEIEFVESGLTVQGRVWKAGQVLTMEDSDGNKQSNQDAEGNLWYELSAKEQKEKYGKVFFEKR